MIEARLMLALFPHLGRAPVILTRHSRRFPIAGLLRVFLFVALEEEEEEEEEEEVYAGS